MHSVLCSSCKGVGSTPDPGRDPTLFKPKYEFKKLPCGMGDKPNKGKVRCVL